MNKKVLISIVFFSFIIFTSGCIREEVLTQDNKIQANQSNQIITTQEVDQQISSVSVECISNIDCNDGNPCTTDSCTNGQCVYVREPDCQFIETQEPYISEVQFTGTEYIKISGKNWDVSNWEIKNRRGELFYKFPDKFKLNNYVIIYSGYGISTSTEKYAGIGNDFWNDQGDKVILVAQNGTVISEKSS